MKNQIAIFSFLMILLSSCTKKEAIPNWGPRLDSLEKAIAVKDAQIAGLSELAYIQALDTVALANDSFNLAAITFANYHLPTPSGCRATCGRKLATHINICNHVAPPNRDRCMQQAIRNYMACIGRCH